jgi:hypothetical protein
MIALEELGPPQPHAFDVINQDFVGSAVHPFKEETCDGSLPPGLRASLPPADLDSLIAYFSSAGSHAEQDIQV